MIEGPQFEKATAKARTRMVMLYLWLIFPVLMLVVHYQFGVHAMKEDKAWQQVKTALALEETARETMTVEDWAVAEDVYSEAIDVLEGERVANARARLELARARCTLYKGELIESMDDLAAQLLRAEASDLDGDLRRNIRETLARAEFGIAWIMRHEGVSASLWRPSADSARQHFRYLAETAPADMPTGDIMENMESILRLARQDIPPPRARKTDGKRRPDASGTPDEVRNAAGEGLPREAANASAEGLPPEAANAAGEGQPLETANAMGEDIPLESWNAAGEADSIADEMVRRQRQTNREGGDPAIAESGDAREEMGAGAGWDTYGGGGS